MLRERLVFSLFLKKRVTLGFWTKSGLLMKSLKIIIISLFYFSGCLFFGNTLPAESKDTQIQNYVKNSSLLQTNKRKAKIAGQKVSGRKIKYYLKNKSVLQSKRGKASTAAVKMVDAGLITASMVKKNRWFVRKPYQTSYTKISSIKQYQPPPVNPEENNRISRKALAISKTRARETWPVKPDSPYSEESSRNALSMSRTMARVAGLNLSKSRARETGPVKPDRLYSESVSRDAMEMTNKRSKKFYVVRKGLVYSAELLKSMGRRPPIIKIPFNIEKSDMNKKAD